MAFWCTWCPVFKMMSFICVFYICGTWFLLGVAAQPLGPTVLASFVENPIIEGKEAMLHCDVPSPPGDYVIDILYGSKFVVRHDEVQPVAGMDMSLSSDGNTLILKIAKIKRGDYGMYTCKVLVPEAGGAWRTVGSSSTSLNVHYFSNPPRCQLHGMFSGLILENGDAIRASCTTNPGNPPVSIQWTKTLASGAITTVPATYGMASYSVFSRFQTNFSRTENNVFYTCTVTSPSFPSATDNMCTIGPFMALPTKPPTTPKRPPKVEDTTFDIPTSDGPQVRIGANPEMGTPTIVGIVVVLLIVTFCTFLFLLFRFRKVTIAKHWQDAEQGVPVKETAVPATKPSPERKKPEIKRKSKVKSFTVMAEVISPKKGKFYPPPPAYPTPSEQQEINQKYLVSNQDVMSVSSWGDILDSPTSTNTGDQFASDGDGLVEPKKESKTDSLKKIFTGGHYYGNIGEHRKQPAVYADVIKSDAKSSRDSVISQTSICSDSPLYASIDQTTG